MDADLICERFHQVFVVAPDGARGGKVLGIFAEAFGPSWVPVREFIPHWKSQLCVLAGASIGLKASLNEGVICHPQLV